LRADDAGNGAGVDDAQRAGHGVVTTPHADAHLGRPASPNAIAGFSPGAVKIQGCDVQVR
jgi:hypothetical protein